MKTAIFASILTVALRSVGYSDSIKVGGGTMAIELEHMSHDEAETIIKKLYYGHYTFKDLQTAKRAKGLGVVREDKEAAFLFLRIPDGAKVSRNEEWKWIHISWPVGGSSSYSILMSYDDFSALPDKYVVRDVDLTIACP